MWRVRPDDMPENEMETEMTNDVAKVYNAMDAFLEYVKHTEDTDCVPREELWANFCGKLSSEMQVALAFQLIGKAIDPDTGRLTRDGKHFAIDLGFEAGPDYLQGFYRFGCAVSNAEK